MEANNAQAMREALLALKELDFNKEEDCHDFYRIIDEALAAPPRNCDRMPDIDKLTMYDLAKSPCKSTLECASREELLALVRWLLATATEQKGETDAK